MDSLNPEQLQALLDLLVETGVEEFEGFGLHVRFTPNLFNKDNEVQHVQTNAVDRMEQANARNLWEMPELWPGGKPPTFPGKQPK